MTLADGDARCAGALLVGCDGRDSEVARRAGIGRRGWDYGQTSLVCAVEHERPHRGIAHQFFMPAGPLAILPLPGNRSSIVWTERARPGRGDRARSTPPATSPSSGRGSATSSARSRLAGARYAYPLGLSLAERLDRPRLALAGDAAHGIHPLAGQGLNLGLRDVAALAEVVVGGAPARPGHRRRRRARRATRAGGASTSRALAAATDGINRLFSNDNPLLRLGRDLGLGAGQPPAGAAPRADRRGRRPRRRPAAPAARPAALRFPLDRLRAGALVTPRQTTAPPSHARVAQG